MMDTKARIAVLVSGGGTNLQALIDAQNAGKLKSGEIVFVVSNNPDAYAIQRARRAAVYARHKDSRVFIRRQLVGFPFNLYLPGHR